MTILDRYIARLFLFNAAALFVIVFSFVVAVDVALNIDQFLKAARQTSFSTVWIIFDWWWPRLLMLFNFLLGIVMVGAMGFACSSMARHRELVALLAGGQPLHRIGRPIFISALALTALQAANQELALPRVAPMLTRDHSAAGQRTFSARGLALTPDGYGRVFAASRFDPDTDTLEGVYILERDASRSPVRAITAARARWDGGAWVLEGARAEARNGSADAGPVDRIPTDLDPTTLKMRRFSVYSQNLGTARLTAMLRRPGFLDERARDQIERIRLGRFSTMAANLLTLLICMPFFLSRVPGNQVLRSLLCAPVAIAGLIGGVLGSSGAVPGLPVWLSVLIAPLLLGTVAIATLSATKT